ncbi:MAG: ferritin-like protein, partial [Chitinophagaceae bacterium]|nr:ferritin-like protein [Rubrivivax sp.]
MNTPAHPPSREQLLYWLHEASEIEHHLMCCYLYAAFSLKRDDPAWSVPQRQAVADWRRAITEVALEEMTHLALVGNLMSALGAAPNLRRPPFPVDSGPYPAGFSIRLQPFSAATIEHFKFLERPVHEQALQDGSGFGPTGDYRRTVPEGRLSPGARDYATVGELYETIAQSLQATAAQDGEGTLFVGDPALQLDATLAPLPGVTAVTDLASALHAVRTIVTQGEGAGGENQDSHFMRFCRIALELQAQSAADPGFEPAWPAATNPLMNEAIQTAADRVHISHPQNARWLDIGNALYTTSLRCLMQGFTATDRRAKGIWLSASFGLMRALVPVGQGLAARPATVEAATPHAGLTFTPLRTLAALPDNRAARVVAE